VRAGQNHRQYQCRAVAFLQYSDKTPHLPTDAKTYHYVDPIPEGDSDDSVYQVGLRLLQKIDPEARLEPRNNGYFDILDQLLS
jgi:hypothetical protein